MKTEKIKFKTLYDLIKYYQPDDLKNLSEEEILILKNTYGVSGHVEIS